MQIRLCLALGSGRHRMTWSHAACSARVRVLEAVDVVEAGAADDSDGVVDLVWHVFWGACLFPLQGIEGA